MIRLRKVLVMPAYNESVTIVGILERAHRFVDQIIVVNDGSTDASDRLVREWMEGRDGAVLLNLVRNRGMSGALQAGFCLVHRLLRAGVLAPDDVIINLDADGQHIPEEIPAALAHMARGDVDVLLTRRDLSCYPRVKQWGNRALSAFASVLSGARYQDVECGFRLMRAGVVPDLLRHFTGLRYGCAQEIGIIVPLLGYRVANDFPSRVAYYRHGARVRDGLVNIAMGALAFLRVKLGIQNDPDRLSSRILAGVEVFPASAAGRVELVGA